MAGWKAYANIVIGGLLPKIIAQSWLPRGTVTAFSVIFGQPNVAITKRRRVGFVWNFCFASLFLPWEFSPCKSCQVEFVFGPGTRHISKTPPGEVPEGHAHGHAHAHTHTHAHARTCTYARTHERTRARPGHHARVYMKGPRYCTILGQ